MVSDSISTIEALASDVARRSRKHYIDDLYHVRHYDNYTATGDVVKYVNSSVVTATRRWFHNFTCDFATRRICETNIYM